MSREYIAKTLKRLREQSGLTADQVGKLVGKSGKTVNAWENNRGQPDAEILMQLCDIYNVTDVLAEFRENNTHATKKAPANENGKSDLQKEQLIHNYDALNGIGKNKLVEYSDDLTGNPKYTKDELSNSPPNNDIVSDEISTIKNADRAFIATLTKRK